MTDNYLDKAFRLAEKGRGRTYPNPMVGAVVVKDGRVVGEGFHSRAGEPHAEIHALSAAGDLTCGATLYVSLEPCCRRGRTGPCTEAIIGSGIRNVVIGVIDPNPKMTGKGIEALRAAGLTVTIKSSPENLRQNEIYFKYIKTGQPFVLLKIAASLDGRIAARVESRTRITGTKANLQVHKLRNEYQAVMVGVDTAIIDNPLLSCRLDGVEIRQPVKIVVDSTGRLPLDSNIVKNAANETVILATTNRVADKTATDLATAGVEILLCDANEQGRVNLADLLNKLGSREFCGIMVEGGSALNQSLLSGGLVDKLLLFYAPVFYGADRSTSMIAGTSQTTKNWRIHDCRRIGEDIMLELYPTRTYYGEPSSSDGLG